MRRLQNNLQFMAAMADRKPNSNVTPCPAYLSAPPLNMALKLRAQPLGGDNPEETIDLVADREERDRSMKDLYRRLQAVYPGFDPKLEPAYKNAMGQKGGNPGSTQASPTIQQGPQMGNMPAPPLAH